MESSEMMVKQLKIIKWLLLFIALSLFVGVGSVAFLAVSAFDLAENTLADNSCDEESFKDKASDLVDEGKTEEAIKLASARILSHPNDQDAYWYRGLAYYLEKKWQPAIVDFGKVEEIVPSWKERYTEPYITAAKAKLGDH